MLNAQTHTSGKTFVSAMTTNPCAMISRRLLPMLLGLCACVALATPAGAVVRYVDGDAAPSGDGLSWASAYDSLDTGLAAAQSGDQIWVAAGTYVGNFTLALEVEVYGGFDGTETELSQRDWTANPTILDGNQTGSVVTSPAGPTETTRIDGFTITNGMTSPGSGGGLYLSSSSPTIANNTITGNGASTGGGLYLRLSSATIAGNTITGNSAESLGGGLFLYGSSPTIVNNTITGNSAEYDGGGLCLMASSPTIANNTITGNSASSGGGLFLGSSSSSPTIANTIVAFNLSGIHRAGGTPTLRYNCLYGNTEYDYYGLADPTGTDGNISADPLFAQNPDPGPDGLWGTPDDDLGDLQLLSSSPCIDAGDNDGVPPDTPDLDGDSDTGEPLPFDLAGALRFLDDPTTPDTGNPGVAGPPIVDIGAYENVAWCGNSVVQIFEQCDDGPGNSDTEPDACRTNCRLPWCGDHVIDTGEVCDDGPHNSDTDPDACRTTCLLASCGDDVVDTGEQCDDGPDNSDTEPDACRTDCRLPWCGDGAVDTGEQCDDGLYNSDTDPDACRTTCVPASCGDGAVDTNEKCDDGGESATCDADCTFAECGDGTVNAAAGEECDDGNKYPGDGCDATCHDEHAIPTVSGWGMIALALSLLAGHKLYFRRRGALR